MDFERIASILQGIPYTSPEKARSLYDFLVENRPAECLELGFAHGTSSCYIAAALEKNGRGHLTTVDLQDASFDPSIDELLRRTGLGHRVTVVRERTSYNWFLKKKIEERSKDGRCEPLYDFCFLDGSKNWSIDGLAFFLADKLLRQGATFLFDDYRWTYRDYERQTGKTVTDAITHRSLGTDEFEQAHVERIFQLLVMQHPEYGEFRIQDDAWAWAKKVQSPTKTVRIETRVSLRAKVVKALKAARRYAVRA